MSAPSIVWITVFAVVIAEPKSSLPTSMSALLVGVWLGALGLAFAREFRKRR